jgi:hypothetical protein
MDQGHAGALRKREQFGRGVKAVRFSRQACELRPRVGFPGRLRDTSPQPSQRNRPKHRSEPPVESSFFTPHRYLVPSAADWAVWDDVNGVLAFMTDDEVVENARENERELGDEFARSPLPPDPTPEQAWAYVTELWEGDPGGRGWQVRVPAGATWVALREDEDDPARGGGPEPTFGFGEPPVGDGAWKGAGLLTGDSYSAG